MLFHWIYTTVSFPGRLVRWAVRAICCWIRGVEPLEFTPRPKRSPLAASDEPEPENPPDQAESAEGDSTGDVITATPGFLTVALVNGGPFLVNSALCAALCWPMTHPASAPELSFFTALVMAAVGISIGSCAFPSNQDARALWKASWSSAKRFNPLAILALPAAGVIQLVNLLSFFLAPVAWGVFIGMVAPQWWL